MDAQTEQQEIAKEQELTAIMERINRYSTNDEEGGVFPFPQEGAQSLE